MQPAALQLETSYMERKRILILDSSGMESTHNGIFLSDGAAESWSNCKVMQWIKISLHKARGVGQNQKYITAPMDLW